MHQYQIDAFVDPQTINFLNLAKLIQFRERPKFQRKKKNIEEENSNVDDPLLCFNSCQISCGSRKVYHENVSAILSPVINSNHHVFDSSIVTEVTLKVNRGLIEVYANIGAQQLLFKLIITSELLPLVSAQMAFFKPKLRNRTGLSLIRPVLSPLTLDLNSDGESVELSFNISYSISVYESIYAFHKDDLVTAMKELSYFSLEPASTPYQLASSHQDLTSFQQTEAIFYNLITSHTEKIAYDKDYPTLSIPGLEKSLMGFQHQTLKWMLEHEGVSYDHTSNQIKYNQFFDKTSFCDDDLARALDRISFGWSLMVHAKTRQNLWYNAFTGNICSTEFAVNYLSQLKFPPPSRALLSEEMGLGKTVEVISLIATNPRHSWAPFDQTKLDYFSDRQVSESKTTLVICPQTIMSQWKSEIAENSESLSVMVYEGVINYERDAEHYGTHLTPSDIAKKLSNHDIVLVSYHTVCRELYRAEFKPTSRPKRHCTSRLKQNSDRSFDRVEYERLDYSSPLMLLEFWRVILDEVQMTNSIESNAAKFARLIPRVHAWGVSGTLIKNNLEDLHSLLCFLRYQPLDDVGISVRSPWKVIRDCGQNHMFIRLFESICLRHTKKMVASQIQLPSQTRMLLRMPFSTIERDNYDFFFEKFLSEVGLDEIGNPSVDGYDPDFAYSYMRQWLPRLRRICSHAQLYTDTKKTVGSREHESSADLFVGTLDDVLGGVLKRAYEDMIADDRSYYSLKLKLGKIYEFLRDPMKSMKVFEELVPEIEGKIKELKEQKEQDDKTATQQEEKLAAQMRIRSWLELLHQTYFLLASSHFQQYRPMRPIPESFEELENTFSDINEKIVVEVETLTSEERVHYDLENMYYKMADNLLMSLLDEPLAKIQTFEMKMCDVFDKFDKYSLGSMSKVKIELELGSAQLYSDIVNDGDVPPEFEMLSVSPVSIIDYSSLPTNIARSGQLVVFLDRLRNASLQLNSQSHIINYWITNLISLLKEPVARYSNDDNNTGAEYGSSLATQELAHTYLAELQLVLEDRQRAIMSVEIQKTNKNLTSRSRQKSLSEMTVKANEPTNYELHLRLDKIRRRFVPDGEYNSKFSLKNIWMESTTMVSDISETGSAKQVSFLTKLSSLIKEEYHYQRKCINNLRTKLFELLNETFNARISYYKSLQIQSDVLVNYAPVTSRKYFEEITPKEIAEKDLFSTVREMSDIKKRVKTGSIRVSYLRSLMNKKAESTSEYDRLCIICQSQIVVGTLTSCGHRYCKSCLHQWFRVHHTCPVCKKKLSEEDMYSFTFTKNELHGGLLKNEKNIDGDEPEEEEMDGTQLSRIKNGKNMNSDFFKVYCSIDDGVLKKIMAISLDKSYGSKIDMITRQVLYLNIQAE
ncbi:unnamed protein product [Ambrosiozyma monospora]|uniref:Unnamed protein product n=1 Tax=Ambrosiozyma monospora TaxID=43982 RepID=A0A9W6YT02_AMBMO|nr:unnamed protein product [Ambrosiozyma monospora]